MRRLNPFEEEARSVAQEEESRAITKAMDAKCQRTKHVNWDNLCPSAFVPGALPESTAQSLTREASHRRWRAQKARRGGVRGLLALIGR